MAITQAGATFSMVPRMISAVSIPVIPITPGDRALTGRIPGPIWSGMYLCRLQTEDYFSVKKMSLIK
jgi:hypothetical protein